MKASIQRVPPTETQFVIRIENIKNLEAGPNYVNITATESQVRTFIASVMALFGTSAPAPEVAVEEPL